jgi:uncharacterized protein YbaA (DUF1428 family)
VKPLFSIQKRNLNKNAVNAKVFADPRMKEICPVQNPDRKLSFDPQRMMYGGFRSIVEK